MKEADSNDSGYQASSGPPEQQLQLQHQQERVKHHNPQFHNGGKSKQQKPKEQRAPPLLGSFIIPFLGFGLDHTTARRA